MKNAGSRGAVRDRLKHLGKRKVPGKPITQNDKIRQASDARRGLRGSGPKVKVPDTEVGETNDSPAEEMAEGE